MCFQGTTVWAPHMCDPELVNYIDSLCPELVCAHFHCAV